jgi:site-specific DNA recombinase
MFLNPKHPFVPRNGHTLQVGIVARISGCTNQKEISLDDQVDHGKELTDENYRGPVDYKIIATKGKGERLDRPELAMIEAEFRKGILDLCIIEDLGRLVRGSEAVRLLGIAVDHGTRVIVINDCIDTADPNWEQDALNAGAEHVAYNTHVSKRLKYKLMRRFLRNGGAPARPIYGYVIPPEAKTYGEWLRDPAATPIIVEAARRLLANLNCSSVADWLNNQRIPTGPYCRRDTWTGKLVRQFFANPLLKGMPSRGNRYTKKMHETGRRISVRNPDGPNYYACPHLAHVEAALFDELNAKLWESNERYRRKSIGAGKDVRKGVSKKRTAFPGQHSRCAYCGAPHVWGGNGITENLMCSASRQWECWNSIGFNGYRAAQKIISAILDELYKLDGFDAQWREMVRAATCDSGLGLDERRKKLERETQELNRQKKNIADTVADYGAEETFKEKLAEFKARERDLARERSAIERLSSSKIELPESVAQLRSELESYLRQVTIASPEDGELLRRLVPDFRVHLVRLCDGGHLLPRADITLDLGGMLSDLEHVPDIKPFLRRQITIDLFEPAQRERIREETVALHTANPRMTQEEIAERIAEKPTATAVQRALKLHRRMQGMGLSSPYIRIDSPPADYTKLRRHRNSKYRPKS